MQAGLTVAIRLARPGDAHDIGAVHVAAWRSTYPGILSDRTLTGMSVSQQSVYYETMIRRSGGVYVAVAGDNEEVVGFCSIGRKRGSTLGDGEIYTLYVLDDWRDTGIGRRLMQVAASGLLALGCHSVFLWVLSDNSTRWFYEHLGGRAVAVGSTWVGGKTVAQTAYLWDPIEMLTMTSKS